MSVEKELEYKKVLEEALNKGYEILENNGTSEKAVIEAINNWWGECILQCGYELTTLETYIIAILALPIIVYFLDKRF